MTTGPRHPPSETGRPHEPPAVDGPRLLALPNGQPIIADTSWVAPGATLVGDVSLGSRSSVWYGAVLRGDGDRIEVGEGSNIQDGCVLHTDPGFPLHVGDGVSVGHRAVLHGCDIGDGVLIGMGAVLLNGARVGPRSLVAAGAVVLEGVEIPAESLVAGTPAKVRRPLTEEEVAAVRENARRYEATSRRHSESAKQAR